MTRRIVWSLTAIFVLVTVAGAWFLSQYEPFAVPTRERPSRAARRDHYLALERFLARMGRPLTRTTDPQLLDRLAPQGVLILDPNRRYHLTNERRDRLFDWVEKGGYLFIVPERDDDSDALIRALDLSWADPWGAEEEDAAERRLPSMPDHVTVRIPETPRELKADSSRGLAVGQPMPVWTAGDSTYGAQFVHFARGQGHITVIVNFDQLASNVRLGDNDHAAILWTLLRRYQPAGPITLVSRMHVPTLFEWLGERASASMVSLAVLVALGLWHIGPRTGRLALDAPPSRRELREHLGAIGFFMWRSGNLRALAATARRALLAHAAARHPAMTAASTDGERAETLAVLTGRSRVEVEAWLDGSVDTPQAFTASMRGVQQLAGLTRSTRASMRGVSSDEASPPATHGSSFSTGRVSSPRRL